VDFGHPANRGILAYLGDSARLQRSVSAAKGTRSCPPSCVEDPYMTLGTHPDLVARLWDELGGTLPVDCRWIVFGTPALVHPDSGVIFAFAGGTHTYAFRLPPRERDRAVAAGATTVHRYPAYPELNIEASVLDLAVVGEEWVFGGWHAGEEEWCRAAFARAAVPGRPVDSATDVS
jgi:hypothetical protein